MKLFVSIYIYLGILLLVSYQCRSDKDETSIAVSCASGLADVITEISDSFTIENNTQVKINLASSGTLARQLAQGNKADIYISASKHWADYADSLGVFSERKPLCQNKLVFISPLNRVQDSLDFADKIIPEFQGRLSIGDPAHVPAGQYGKEALISLGWWDALKERTLPAKDVRSALMPVELGECELGIVYYSDAKVSNKVKIAGIFPDTCHTPIVFHALLSKNPSPSARQLYLELKDPKYESIWKKHGLTTITSSN